MKRYASFFFFVLGLSLSVFSAHASTNTAPEVYFNFNADNGAVVEDASGNGHAGEVHGAQWNAQGFIGGCYEFQGTNWISVGDASGFQDPVMELTACVWVRASDTLPNAMFVLGNSSATEPYAGWGLKASSVVNGRCAEVSLVASFPQHATVFGSSNIRNDFWHMVCGVFEISTNLLRTKVYVDGTYQGMYERVGSHESLNTESNLIYIGLQDPSGVAPFQGLIDEVRIYQTALSSETITSLYQADQIAAAGVGLASCTILPAEAVGAQWKLTSGPETSWQESGAVVTNLPVGAYTVSFKSLSGWQKPSDEIVNVAKDAVASVTGLYSVVSTTNELLLYYSFDQNASTGLVSDLSGSGYDGTIVGATWSESGLSGGCYSFDGSDRIEVGDVLDVGGSLTALTACVWAKLPPTWAGAEVFLFGKLDQNHPYTGWGFMASRPDVGDKAIAALEGEWPIGVDIYGTSDIRDGTWHMVSAVFESTPELMRTRLYVDGQFEGETVRPGAHPSTVSLVDLWLGERSPGGANLVGELDEIRVYGKALTDGEIASLYAEDAPEPAFGSLSCTIAPAEAAGAQWKLLSGPQTDWQESGSVVTNLPVGAYTVSFKSLSGWQKPSDELVNVVQDAVASVT
ncbi:MAG TPA: hypothetical protein DCZ95_08215, partial [Verrucomicrobia bacterium]|nr:hypothetical protein [Verrucomicrobiota bacterium]